MRDIMGGFMRESGLGAKLRDWDIYDAWGKALGTDLARHARPVGFSKGELVVEVDKETFRLALSDIASAQLVYEH